MTSPLDPAVGGVPKYALEAAWKVAEWEQRWFQDVYSSTTVEGMAERIREVVDPVFEELRTLLGPLVEEDTEFLSEKAKKRLGQLLFGWGD